MKWLCGLVAGFLLPCSVLAQEEARGLDPALEATLNELEGQLREAQATLDRLRAQVGVQPTAEAGAIAPAVSLEEAREERRAFFAQFVGEWSGALSCRDESGQGTTFIDDVMGLFVNEDTIRSAGFGGHLVWDSSRADVEFLIASESESFPMRFDVTVGGSVMNVQLRPFSVEVNQSGEISGTATGVFDEQIDVACKIRLSS